MNLNKRIETALITAFNEAELNGETIKNNEGVGNIINKIRRIDPCIQLDDNDLQAKIMGYLWGTKLFDLRLVPNGGKNGRKTYDQYFKLSSEGKYYQKMKWNRKMYLCTIGTPKKK